MKLRSNAGLWLAAGDAVAASADSHAEFAVTCVAPPPVSVRRVRTLAELGSASWLVLADFSPADYEFLESILDAPELATAAAFRDGADRQSYVFAHGVLRVLLGRYFEAAPSSFAFARRSCHCPEQHPGKPYAIGRNVEFSLSHTRGAVAVVVAAGACGIDVERWPSDEHLATYVPLLPDSERCSEVDPTALSPAEFAQVWTTKEALVKLTGLPLTID